MKTKIFFLAVLLLPLFSLAFISGNSNCHSTEIIRPGKDKAAGTVSGVLSGMQPGMMVTLQNETALHSTHPDPLTGEFFFQEVQAGTYTLYVCPANEAPRWAYGQITVKAGENTDAGFIKRPGLPL